MVEGIKHTRVLIAGAGPVGLSLAIELGRNGISCVVVERNDRVGYSPRAKTTNVRSREHLRRWGIADNLRAASPIPADYPPNVVFATRMTGPVLARFENAFNGSRQRNELYSEEAQWVPQYTVEEVLRAHAMSLPGVSVVFQTELQGFVQDEAGVVADIADMPTGARHSIRCDYLVGADGARSFVREAIGVRMDGGGVAATNVTVIFRAPELAQRHSHGPAIMYWMVNEDLPSFLAPMDAHGLWSIIATKLPDDSDPARADVASMIRRGIGIPDLPMEIVRTHPWISRSVIADGYRRGRVFLAGDACHLHPPFGGFGMNMGIGDAVDLGWKLAATLQGWGGPGLLNSYEPERRPVHERTISEANINYANVGNQLVRPGLEAAGPEGDAQRAAVGRLIQETKHREFHTLGVVLGVRYAGSPILAGDPGNPPEEHFGHYVPSAYPGCIAPHAWLGDGSSLYDHFGAGYTLLSFNGGGGDAMIAAAAERGIPLRLFSPDDPRLPDLYCARFALIRPDQHVAWRGDTIPVDSGALLDLVTGRL